MAIEDGGQTPVHVAVDGHFAGVIFIADVLRPSAREALEKLKGSGVKRIVMLTGDNEATARAVAAERPLKQPRIMRRGHRACGGSGTGRGRGVRRLAAGGQSHSNRSLKKARASRSNDR